MKIVNPFWPHPHVRFRFSGDICLVTGAREIDVPEEAADCLIEPIARGRSDAPPVGQGRKWSPTLGIMTVEDYEKKLQLDKNLKDIEDALKAKRKAEQDEARERKVKAKQDIKRQFDVKRTEPKM